MIKTQGKGRGHGSHGLAALVLRGNAFWSDLGVYLSPSCILNKIIYEQPGLKTILGLGLRLTDAMQCEGPVLILAITKYHH